MIRTEIFVRALFFSSWLLLLSCHKDNPVAAIDAGYNYFPSGIGHWIIYDVDSTYYEEGNGNVVTLKYQLKEIIESTFDDNSGRPTQRIERYTRLFNPDTPYDQLPWQIAAVWTSNLTPALAERKEDNQTYIKLIFPPRAGKKWNGNASNAMDKWEYEYTAVDVAQTVNLSFDSTLTVTQTGLNDPIINIQTSTEIYARNVGMIYKSFRSLKMQPDTSGSEYSMIIHDYSP